MSEPPEKCVHGVPFYPRQHCTGCEIAWEKEQLEWAKARVEKAQYRLDRLYEEEGQKAIRKEIEK